MSVHLAHQEPSVGLRTQIEAVSCRMDHLFRERALYAPTTPELLARWRSSFTQTAGEACLCCDIMDDASSTGKKGRASGAASLRIDTLSGLENGMAKFMAQETKRLD